MQNITEKRTSEYIAEQIADEILSGRIGGEYPLKQEVLAESLGVSRIPVREALQMLELQGLVIRLSTRHILAATITDENIYETFSMIAEVEKRILLENQGEEFQGLRGMEFHKMICQSSKNTYLGNILQNAIQYYIRFAISISTKENRQQELIDIICQEVKNKDKKKQSERIDEYFKILSDNVIKERGVNK